MKKTGKFILTAAVVVVVLIALSLSWGRNSVTSDAFKEITDLRAESKKPLMLYSTDSSIF